MLLGLLVACIGMENPGGVPRFTFGVPELLGGVEAIPVLVGVFAVSEVIRALVSAEPPPLPRRKFGSILAGQLALTRKYWRQMTRGNIVGIIIGVLPGAGAPSAAAPGAPAGRRAHARDVCGALTWWSRSTRSPSRA